MTTEFMKTTLLRSASGVASGTVASALFRTEVPTMRA